ncbi:MAG: DNA-3-methyladenine glycosylase family protein [Lachnospiraceae bacterium]
MIEKKIEHLDLNQICHSGQCFRMSDLGNETYALIAHGRRLAMEQRGTTILFDCTEQEFEELWYSYFDLATDYAAVKSAVNSEDTYLQNAMLTGSGIRILRQELWEMIITYIISQRNNIPRIKRCVNFLCERFGEQKTDSRGELFYTFPQPEAIAVSTDEVLRECNLGYRSRYVLQTARDVADGVFDLRYLSGLPYEEAREELLRLHGVGNKVAECICLFALHHVEAFPIDTHIQQMLQENYPQGFPFEAYAGYAGILQQYAFYYELNRRL